VPVSCDEGLAPRVTALVDCKAAFVASQPTSGDYAAVATSTCPVARSRLRFVFLSLSTK
jgi:hypothetical protein